MDGKYYTKAVDPNQYDREDIHWLVEGVANSPVRVSLREQLTPLLKDTKGKTVLDVGSGTGWLSEILYGNGAKNVVGIEPSKRNIAYSKNHYPDLKIYEGTIETYAKTTKFDIILVILVLEHVVKLDETFLKLKRLLKAEGELIIVLGDIDMLSRTKDDRKTSIERHTDELSVVRRYNARYGTMYDLLRPLTQYVKILRASGFKVTKQEKLDGLGKKGIFHLLVAK